MYKKQLPEQDFLKECFLYSPDTGDFFWKKRPRNHFSSEHSYNVWNKRYSYKIITSFICSGRYKKYLQVGLKYKQYLVHRLIWVIVYNEIPNEIDHINGNSLDNRIINLRNVTKVENLKNIKLRKSNKSGIIGVHWHKRIKKWAATIGKEGKVCHLGYFSDKNNAAKIRKIAEKEFGYHNNHGSTRICTR